MTGSELSFPLDDAEQFEKDCRLLRSLLTGNVTGYVDFLRAMADLSRDAAAQSTHLWPADRRREFITLGIEESVQRGVVTGEMLRMLAHDPALFDQIADDVFERGTDSVWFADDEDSADRDQREALLEVDQLIRDSSSLELESSELGERYFGIANSDESSRRWAVHVPVVIESCIVVRLGATELGRIVISRTAPSGFRIVSTSGPFLAKLVTTGAIATRAAASSQKRDIERVRISCSQDEIILELAAPFRA